MGVEYTIICDGCGHLLDENIFSAAAARKVVKEQLGGVQRGRHDYCHDCAKDRKMGSRS